MDCGGLHSWGHDEAFVNSGHILRQLNAVISHAVIPASSRHMLHQTFQADGDVLSMFGQPWAGTVSGSVTDVLS